MKNELWLMIFKEVSKTRLKICGSTYKVSSCIFHHGFNIEKGNYSVMMRNGASSWNSVHDQKIRKSPWPRNSCDIHAVEDIPVYGVFRCPTGIYAVSIKRIK